MSTDSTSTAQLPTAAELPHFSYPARHMQHSKLGSTCVADQLTRMFTTQIFFPLKMTKWLKGTLSLEQILHTNFAFEFYFHQVRLVDSTKL